MYYILTTVLGWLIINMAFNVLASIIGFNIGIYFFLYVVVGYIVMSVKGIDSPLNGYNPITPEDSPIHKIKTIELKLFFKEIYYAMWWPYYLLHKK